MTKQTIFIDIPYKELKKAVVEAEKKKGICKLLPHGRFTFEFVRDCGYSVRRVEESDGQKINFDLLVCEGIGGKSTGTSANICKNCVIDKCKHKHTKKEKCSVYPEKCDTKYHIKCEDCGTLVDLLTERKLVVRQLKRELKKVRE